MSGWLQFFCFTDACAVYLTLQLVWCVMFSFALIGIVMLLRRTICSKLIFAKGILWSLFLIVPFLGKMKMFYENELVVKATFWMTSGIMTHIWIAYVYMLQVFFSFLYIFGKRLHLQRIVSRMEKRSVGKKLVYITDMNVTPFTVGLLRPRIVLPKLMTDNYSRNETEAIIRHEQTHIRLGHLWCYFIWDILRCLLWLDPFLTLCLKYFRADMEDMCDRVCIQNSGKTAYEYGRLLLKTLILMRSGPKSISAAVTYAGEGAFEDMKRRIEIIAGFRSYRRSLCRSMALIVAVWLGIVFMGIDSISYDRYNEMENILVYEYDAENGNAVILDSSDRLQQIISYDDHYVYVDRAAFETLLGERNPEKEVYIIFGGYQKLPGIGGSGHDCLYKGSSEEEIVRIPYEKLSDDWMTVIFKMI